MLPSKGCCLLLKPMILIENNNCSTQCKFAEHFHDLQDISNDENKKNKILVWFYEAEGHGKREVDHVCSVVKVSAQDEMTRGTVFDNAAHIVSHLIQLFGTYDNPKYNIKEITVHKLEKERLLRHKKVFRTIAGSVSFQGKTTTF